MRAVGDMWRGILSVALSTAVVWGQALSIGRSDGGSERFLLAGERVRLMLAVTQGSVYGAGCRLRYSPAQVVVVSGWRAGSFPPATTVVLPGIDQQTGEGVVDVAALSTAQPIGQPRLAEIEFVIAPEAPHGVLVRFQVTQGWALQQDSVVSVPNVSVDFLVHGYVQVWPGDANDDGSVDVRDVAVVGLYAHRGTMGFRRVPASTEWAPQLALAWEQPEATHADCDGNGVVGVRDLAVVLQNYGRRRGELLPPITPPPAIEPAAGQILCQWWIPEGAELIVGVFSACAGETLRELALGGEAPVQGVVVGLDSVAVVAAYVRGSTVLRLFGEGKLCNGEVEVRTVAGTWQSLGEILHADEPREEELQVCTADGGWLCLRGSRVRPGWMVLYSLLGAEISRVWIPPGEGEWCIRVPAAGPILLLYRTENGVEWRRSVVVPGH